jgi:hypothetical protein
VTRQAAAAIIAASLTVAGCGHDAHRSLTTTTATAAEWKAVIKDFLDGGIDHRHSCSAVRGALARLPTPTAYSTAQDELHAYEAKVC